MKQLRKKLLGLMLTLCVALSMPALLSQLGATSMIAQAATLSSKKVTLIKDTKKTLKLSGAKGGVKWSTSNKSIATVSSKGVVTAKKAGTATITATNKNQKYTCTVIVEAPKLSNTKLTVKNGTTATLKLDGTTQTVKWSTSNKSIATVSSKGVVTAKKAGSVTISAKVGGKTYKCKVTVQAVPVKLSNTSLSLEVGGTFDLRITGATGTVKWSSNKTSVATVSSSGKVTAKKAGTATITATVNGKKYNCKVTVDNRKNPITSVLLDKTALLMDVGEKKALQVTYIPSNTTDDKTVIWKSSNNKVAMVDDGIITAINSGETTITATVGKVSATCIVVVEKAYGSFAATVTRPSGAYFILIPQNGKALDMIVNSPDTWGCGGHNSPTEQYFNKYDVYCTGHIDGYFISQLPVGKYYAVVESFSSLATQYSKNRLEVVKPYLSKDAYDKLSKNLTFDCYVVQVVINKNQTTNITFSY